MSFLRRGERRRGKVATAATTVAALAAFQALAIIGAGAASAATGCTYNLASQTVTVTIDPGQGAGLAVETAADNLDAESPAGAILFDNWGAGFEDGANSTQCGSATNSNTVAINVLGSPGNDEYFYIDEASGAPFDAAIAWSVDLGSNAGLPPVGGDWLGFYLASGQTNALTLTDTSFDLNGAVGKVLGTETMYVDGGDLADEIDGSALSANVYFEAYGEDGNDWIAPGAFDGDYVDGMGGLSDQVSYATRTTCTVIDNPVGIAGHDANCDGDLADVGDEVDTQFNFEVLETGSGNDTLIGLAGWDETFIPGDGDDDITGNAADDDVLDWSSSSAAMTIDPFNGTATGQGTDTFADVYGYVGSDFADELIWDGTTWGFSGGAGVDKVNASAETTNQTIDLDALDNLSGGADDLENAIGGSGDDELNGNALANTLEGVDGNDELNGEGGNDILKGGFGNNDLEGGDGADTVKYDFVPVSKDYRMEINLDQGYATTQKVISDPAMVVSDTIWNMEWVTGSPNDDSIRGDWDNNTIRSGKGNDTIRSGAGEDNLKGGAGDDQLWGGKGDDEGWGGKGLDVCNGVEIRHSCAAV